MTVFGAPRILIVRLSAIGDVIHGMPVACALRRHWPGAQLAWVVEGRNGDLLEGHPAVDRLIRVPRKWLKSPSQVAKLRRQLRQHAFDLAIDLQGLTKSAVAARLSGAPRRIGFGGHDGRELSRVLNNDLVEPAATHVVDRNLELLRPLGIGPGKVEFQVPNLSDAEQRIEHYLASAKLTDRFAIINPGAGWPSKLWEPDRFAEVACHLGTQHRLTTVVVWAGNRELHMAEQILAGSETHAVLAPSTSLAELASLCRRATLFVGCDTGPMHLSAAVGTRTIGLFGPVPYERNGPYGPGCLAIQKARLEGGSRQRRNATNATMLAIGSDDVIAACDQLLDQTPDQASQVA